MSAFEKLDESDRQMIVLALAKLTFTRPGWKYALRETAGKMGAAPMFDEFVSHGPEVRRDEILCEISIDEAKTKA